jgi:hypothetical protein
MKKVLFLFAISAFVVALQGENVDKDQPQATPPPAFMVSASTNTNSAALFQNLNINPEQQRKRMQYRAEYEKLNYQVAARTEQLFQNNEELKKMREEICTLQEKIEKILKEDAELKALYEKQKNLMPPFPATSTMTPAVTGATATGKNEKNEDQKSGSGKKSSEK